MRLALIVVAALTASPTLAARMTDWDSATNGTPHSYMLAGYTLTFSAKETDGMKLPHLTIKAPGLPAASLDGEPSGSDVARAGFAVLKLSPKERPSVIFTSYSGGAHCCVNVTVLQPTGKSWNRIELGSWDGGGIALPRDVDGDGTVDFVFVDNAFLYAFDSYAGSRAPPLILNIVDGKAVNVSTAPRYAATYRADMAQAKAACAEHDANGACAAYVADAARLSRLDEAWAFMLAHYDRQSSWDYPTRCTGPKIDGACKTRELKPRDYPQSLRWFLEDNGYIAK